MLKCTIKAIISNAKGREYIARRVVQSLFDVVVLEIEEFLVGYCSLGSLPVEKSCIGSDSSGAFAVLYK